MTGTIVQNNTVLLLTGTVELFLNSSVCNLYPKLGWTGPTSKNDSCCYLGEQINATELVSLRLQDNSIALLETLHGRVRLGVTCRSCSCELLVTATLWSSVVFSMLSAPSGSWLPGSPLSEPAKSVPHATGRNTFGASITLFLSLWLVESSRCLEHFGTKCTTTYDSTTECCWSDQRMLLQKMLHHTRLSNRHQIPCFVG